jgi:hypothetical protein
MFQYVFLRLGELIREQKPSIFIQTIIGGEGKGIEGILCVGVING